MPKVGLQREARAYGAQKIVAWLDEFRWRSVPRGRRSLLHSRALPEEKELPCIPRNRSYVHTL